MCYALAMSQGISSLIKDTSLNPNKRKTLMKKMKKPKIKII
jgi:hypothetical protein